MAFAYSSVVIFIPDFISGLKFGKEGLLSGVLAFVFLCYVYFFAKVARNSRGVIFRY